MTDALRRLLGADLVLRARHKTGDTWLVIAAPPEVPTGSALRLPGIADEPVPHARLLEPGFRVPSSVLLTLHRPPAVAMLAVQATDGGGREAVLALWGDRAAVPPALLEEPSHLSQVPRLFAGTAEPDPLVFRDSDRLRAILDALPIGVVYVDEQRAEAVANGAAAHWLGSSVGMMSGEALAIGIRRLIDRVRDSDRAGAEVAALVRGPRSAAREWTWELADPPDVVLRVTSQPLDAAAQTGRLWTLIDISRERMLLHKLAEQQALERKLQQAQRLEIVGRLAAGVAHDFNNLLTIIAGSAELLQGTELTTAGRADVGAITGATDRARRLTRQLLTFTAQQVELPVVFGVDDRIRASWTLLQRVLLTSQSLAADLTAGDAAVLLDPGQFELALLNLLANARDAMRPDGRATVWTRLETLEGVPAVGAVRPLAGDFIAITVADDGHGVASDVAPQIFDPFVTTRDPGKGTGLGLPTLVSIVSRAGGGVRYEAPPEGGAAFTVYLPRVSAAEPAGPRGESGEDANDTRRWPVLLVDDEAGPRAVVARILGKLGHDVHEADSMEAALAWLTTHEGRVAGIVTDFLMPGGTGADLLQRALPQWPDTPALVISGFAADLAVDASLASRGVGFLAKPFTIEELRGALQQVGVRRG